jgi:hypothetical protein
LKGRKLAGVLGCTLALVVPASAIASHEDTLMNVDFKTTKKTRKAGTKAKPRPVNLTIAMSQSTRSGTGQPATSTDLNVTLPKQLLFIGKIWPKKLRCDPAKANQRRSDSACPKGSKIGSGHVTATAGDGGITSEIAVRAYVTKGGDLGLWLTTTQPLPINEMLVGEVSKGRKIQISIPPNIQQPLTGVKSAIRVLRFSLNDTTRIKGKARGIVESIGCPKGKLWALAFQNVYEHGSTTDSDTTPCRA